MRLLRPQESPPPLTWTERKAKLLKDLGVDCIVAYPTDLRLLQLSAQQFFDRIVVEAIGARAMVEGPNFYFGHNREGTIDRLVEMTRRAGMTLDIVLPVELEGQLVSSSLIRRLIGNGDVAMAATMLTAPYRIRGMVTHGVGRGATIGFPTANLEAIDTLLPAVGVYGGFAIRDGARVACVINVGRNPTFVHEGQVSVEASADGTNFTEVGRVTDASLVVGPCAWWHDWAPDAWNELAGAVLAGHIIECGPHATGGNFTGFERIPGMLEPGFPIAEVAADGSCIITKHAGHGGAVRFMARPPCLRLLVDCRPAGRCGIRYARRRHRPTQPCGRPGDNAGSNCRRRGTNRP